MRFQPIAIAGLESGAPARDWSPARRQGTGVRRAGVTARVILLAAGLGVGVAAGVGAQPAESDRPTATAVRIETPPRVDGVLDEPFWDRIPPVTGFRQRDPVDGAPASERTEVRIAYDEQALYFGFTFFDSEPDRIRRSILHRGGRIDKDDRVIIGLDTYLDRRNAYIFEVGAPGTQDDALLADESLDREDWNWDGVFTTETRVTPDGWVLEMRIPFTTIRFADVESPVMGIAFSRSIRRKNETVTWPHIGQDYRSGIAQVSQYADLVGLTGIRRGRRVEVRPYGLVGAQQFAGEGGFTGQTTGGADLKYGITPNLTIDLTWNTDFAQVESDNVQINLTRFSLFYPEKREFFLERAGLFQFGDSGSTTVFFSRRVGLETDIQGGGRLTGQVGRFSVGALALRTADGGDGLPSAWNSVGRVQLNLTERATAGIIGTSLDRGDGHSSRAAGADFVTRFWSSSSFRMWGARLWESASEEEDGGGSGWRAGAGAADLDLQNDRYGLKLNRTVVGKDFNPALGFARRRDMDQWSAWGGFQPRFESSRWARRFSVWGGGGSTHGTGGELQSRNVDGNASLAFESGESVYFRLNQRFERLHEPVAISGRVLPAGDYDFRSWETGGRTNDSRMFSAFLSGSGGEFWGGERTRLGAGITLITGPHLTAGAQVDRSDISLPVTDGDFTATLFGLNLDGAVSRKLFASALIQWDDFSKELQANVRVDWIHTPGSDLFIVLDTGYLTDGDLDPRIERWTRRTGVVKLTWLRTF